jgi:two-component system chemotaxis response regulator CheB
MVSAHTQDGAEAAVRALHLGAVDFVSKASLRAKTDLAHIDAELRPKLRAWSRRRASEAPPADAQLAQLRDRAPATDLVVIAASTGGPQTLTALLKLAGPIAPPIVIALHIPEFFTASLADMLTQDTGCRVREGTHGQPLDSGSVTLIPGGRDGVIARGRGGGCELRLVSVQSSVHPSGDALLESAAMVAKAPIGVVLTGMGDDAARGAAALRRRSAPVLIQAPATCVVDGMPSAAIAAAPDALVLNIETLAATLAHWSRPGASTAGDQPATRS